MTSLSILYYTGSAIARPFAEAIRSRLVDVARGLPIVSVSQEPLDFGHNLCVGRIGQSVQNIYRQILLGAKAADTEYVACAEDDMLYVPAHFAERPERGVFAYNLNRWHLDPPDETRSARFRWRNRTGMCACVCHRQDLIDTLEARFQSDPNCRYAVSWGEPGKYEWKFSIPRVERRMFQTEQAVVHVNHGGLNGVRKRIKTDMVAKELPGWGSAQALWEVVHG